ncbi:CG30428 [Drosophila busckii]|uniref:Regulatory protein zeste n=2 Tax=Drosophila busckii TaxID=30019 RepID=A0A0M4EXR6_DROBS|nr:CG30428 [Drosophila busckii]
MERHPQIAKNLKGDKLTIQTAWKRLSKELNSVGPPVKDPTEWRRVWKDWKLFIKRKIACNRLDPNGRGKAAVYQDTLTPLEDAVATITDLYDVANTSVDAKPKGKDKKDLSGNSLRLQNIKTDHDEFENDDEGAASSEEELEEDEDEEEEYIPQRSAKKRKMEHDSFNSFASASLETDNKVLKDIVKELRNLNKQTRLNAERTEANTEALLAMGSQIADLMHEQIKERKRLNSIMEKFVLKMQCND